MKYLNKRTIMCNKGEDIKISPHFNSKEFEDDLCDYMLIDMDLIEILEKMRVEINSPIKINSAYRSQKKQLQLQDRGYHVAKGMSTHQVGSAVDIQVKGMLGKDLAKIATKHGIKAIGVANTWLHIDMRQDKLRVWYY